MTFSKYYATGDVTVKPAPLALSAGNSSACNLASTLDYASVSVTAGLDFVENADLILPTQAASPSLDGSNCTQVNLATNGSCAVTTTKANDVIYVAITILGTANTLSVTDASGTSLIVRGNITSSTGVRCETWYKIAQNAGTQIINVWFPTATTFAITAFGVKDANMPNPFDVTSGNPMIGTGVGSTQAVTVGSIISNTLVLGAVAIKGSVTPNIGSGFTKIQRSNSGGLGEGVSSKSLTSTGDTTVIFTTGISQVNWAMISDVIWGKLPALSVDTGFSTPTTGGSAIINNREGYLVSPAYPSATTIYTGWWKLNLWVESQNDGDSLSLLLLVTDSSYNIVSDVCSRMYSGPISTVASLVTVECEQPQVSVPLGGHIIVVLSNPAVGSSRFTVYWGTEGLTNFTTNQVSNYVLQVNNIGPSSYSLCFSVRNLTAIDRLANLTLYVYSPASTYTAVLNGTITQSVSSATVLDGASKLYLALDVAATNFNYTSNLTFYLMFSTGNKPFACDVINLAVN